MQICSANAAKTNNALKKPVSRLCLCMKWSHQNRMFDSIRPFHKSEVSPWERIQGSQGSWEWPGITHGSSQPSLLPLPGLDTPICNPGVNSSWAGMAPIEWRPEDFNPEHPRLMLASVPLQLMDCSVGNWELVCISQPGSVPATSSTCPVSGVKQGQSGEGNPKKIWDSTELTRLPPTSVQTCHSF